ncbi:MAG: type I restriction endonuclease [Acidobacteriota bacterium]
MSFQEKITALAQRVPELAPHLATEEATKNALVLPFIAALGYDVFDPTEVVPELNADVGVKKGEKVDYAIRIQGEVAILVECKCVGVKLDGSKMSQLYRYFSVTNARIGVLTDGVRYRFFSDLEEQNRMDSRPFLELDLTDLRDDQVNEVAKLAKDRFDLERMLGAAHELKYLREIQRTLDAQLEDPHIDLVRFFFSQAQPDGRFTQQQRELFTELVKKALQQFVRERVNRRLRSALAREDDEPADVTEDDEPRPDGVETTEEELEGFQIVKAIVAKVVAPQRIVHRDTKSYMGVLLDDNNRKPICRLHFNTGQKYLGTFDREKNETRHPIESLDELYGFTDQLREAALSYDE